MVVPEQTATLIASPLRLGGMRFSAFGVCASVGLLASFGLMRWTAPMASLDRERLMDAGFFGLLAGFVVTRLLLVAQEPVAFLHYPMLVLSLPSFTYAGMGLTAVALAVYLRWKRMAFVQVLDAWAPCAALLAAALSVGYFIEGSHDGMPTSLPWAVNEVGVGKVHPVQMYFAVAAIWLCVVLLIQLARAHVAGRVAQSALVGGGLCVFLLEFLCQPDPGAAHALLETAQWVSIAAFAVGLGWLIFVPAPLPKEAR